MSVDGVRGRDSSSVRRETRCTPALRPGPVFR